MPQFPETQHHSDAQQYEDSRHGNKARQGVDDNTVEPPPVCLVSGSKSTWV